MSMLHRSDIDAVMSALLTTDDPHLAKMEARAERDGFPTVGWEVGHFLRWAVVATGAKRVFECGSGFGYSAYWMATALPADGEIVLTEIDAHELDDARKYLEAASIDATIRYEHADALEALKATDGRFDLILLDHENERYREGFDTAAKHLSPGGMIIADNVMHSYEFGPGDLATALQAQNAVVDNPSLAGIVEYCRYVWDQSDFVSIGVPLGEGVLVSAQIDG